MGVNSLPKTVTRQCRDCDLNPGPSAPESSTLTTRLPSRPRNIVYWLSTTIPAIILRVIRHRFNCFCRPFWNYFTKHMSGREVLSGKRPVTSNNTRSVNSALQSNHKLERRWWLEVTTGWISESSSHHIQETDAGLDRPLYVRNKLYDKPLKSQNSNILRFPVPWRSALWLYNTSWLTRTCLNGF